MWWHRETLLDHLCFAQSDRELVVELFGLLQGTEEKWRSQGATDAECDLAAFAWDQASWVFIPFDHGPLSGIEESVTSESDSERILQDRFGRKSILAKKSGTIPLPQNFPMTSPEDWHSIKPWFRPEDARMDFSQLESIPSKREKGGVVRLQIWGAYDILRELMGDEEACIAVLEEPDLVQDILDTVADMQIQGIQKAHEYTPIDFLSVHEDFAGKSGPLVGPNIIRNLFNPYYRRIWDSVKPRGTRLFDLDSDGFIEPIVDALLEGGINCLHPIEPAAGSDMVGLRKRYGNRLTLRGGINKFALTRGKSAIDEELEYRCQPCMRGGGTMFGLDHRIPDGVSISAYRYYVMRLRETLNLPPLSEEKPGWCRMA